MSSPSRRHAQSRIAQRKWEDMSEWPLQFIILPVLVAFAFCLVLFLGSKHGTRLAAFRTWFPTSLPCRAGKCIQTITVDSEGGLVAGLSTVGPAGGGGALGSITGGGTLTSIAGLLRLDNTPKQIAAGATADDFGVLPVAPEDALKYDFEYWLAEGEKLVGQQSKDCDSGYGFHYVDKWRRAHVEWCTASSGAAQSAAAATTATTASATAGAAAAAAQEAAAGSTAAAKGAARRRLLELTTGSVTGGNKTGPAAGASGDAAARSHAQADSGAASAAAVVATGPQAVGNSSGGGGGDAAAAGHLVTSRISLFPYHDKDAYLMFASATNTVIDSRSFLGSLPGEMPEARAGSYLAGCHWGAKPTPGDEYMAQDAVRRWTKDALKTEEYDKVEQACTARADSSKHTHGPVEHPVLLLSRLDSTSAFRTVEEVVSAFTALAVLRDKEVAQKGIQVVLADGKPDGFYLDLWAELSRPYPLRILSQNPWPPNTCLSHAVHAMYGGASILSSMGVARRTTCRSSVAMGASLWLRHVLDAAIQPPVRSAFGAQLQNKGVVRKSVVWISRRNFEGLAQANLTPWQDQRRFENEGEVVLELQREVWRWNDEACLRSGLTKSFGSGHRRLHALRRLKAMFGMDRGGAAVTTAATAAALATTAYLDDRAVADQHLRGGGSGSGSGTEDGLGQDDGPRVGADTLLEQQLSRRRLHAGTGRCRPSTVFFDLRVVELNDIPFYPDHLQVLGRAAVLAGAHGTGLANMIWMAPGGKAGVLELHHNSAGNDHYHNMANLLGHKYVSVESDGDRVELPAAAEGLRKLLDMLG